MYSVAWREGQPLFAEHLHAWSQCQRENDWRYLRVAGPGADGCVALVLDADWIKGRLQVLELEWVLPTGELVSRDDLACAFLELPAAEGFDDLWVGVQPAPMRFVERLCENPIEPGCARSVEFAYGRWQLLWQQGVLGPGFVPLLCLSRRGGCWCNSPAWLPAVLRPHGHPAWRERLQEIRTQLFAREELAEAGRLRLGWSALLYMHPSHLFLECASALELNAEYDHVRPLRWLEAVEWKLKSHSKTAMRPIREQAFAELENGIFMVVLHGFPLQSRAHLKLIVRYKAGQLVPQRSLLRLGALSRLPRMLRMALPGIVLHDGTNALNPGELCFVLERSGLAWEECLGEGVMGLHCLQGSPDWKFVLQIEECDE